MSATAHRDLVCRLVNVPTSISDGDLQKVVDARCTPSPLDMALAALSAEATELEAAARVAASNGMY